jgi:hypothetical protein
VRFVSVATHALVAVAALMILVLVFSDEGPDGDTYDRALGVVAVLDVLGLLLAPIVRTLDPKAG